MWLNLSHSLWTSSRVNGVSLMCLLNSDFGSLRLTILSQRREQMLRLTIDADMYCISDQAAPAANRYA